MSLGVYLPCIHRTTSGVVIGDSGLCCCGPTVCVSSIVQALLIPFVDSLGYVITRRACDVRKFANTTLQPHCCMCIILLLHFFSLEFLKPVETRSVPLPWPDPCVCLAASDSTTRWKSGRTGRATARPPRRSRTLSSPSRSCCRCRKPSKELSSLKKPKKTKVVKPIIVFKVKVT